MPTTAALETNKTPGISKFQQRSIQGVDYWHRKPAAAGGDLFLTRFGLPFAKHLDPANWLSEPWFSEHRRRLRGTSAIYYTQTKPVAGKSLEIVVRYNRVGQELPVDTLTRDLNTAAAFNTPFEEIAEVMRLRRERFGPKAWRVPTKRPLAIYSPPTRMQLWQTGRNESQIAAKLARNPEVELDILRTYILVYGWIKGIDLQDLVDDFCPRGGSRQQMLDGTMAEVEGELAQAGFRVLDMKPAHIVVRVGRDGRLKRRKNGRLVYALIDYELMERI